MYTVVCGSTLKTVAAYRIKPSATRRVEVRLGEQDHALRFEVADDGVGFDPSAANASSGLQNMTDRIGALGGELEITSAPGEGAAIAGRIPLEG
jgi:signal transduction histidine kinase